MSTCDEIAIRRVEQRSEIHSNESQHLAERREVARLRRRLSFVLQQTLSFHSRHHLCIQEVALASTRQLRSQGPVFAHTNCTKGITGFEGREGANGVGGGIGVGGGTVIGGGNGDGSGDGNGVGGGGGNKNGDGHGDGDGDGNGDGGEDLGTNKVWERRLERGRKR